jgi:Tfp pilus assembly protein PilO
VKFSARHDTLIAIIGTGILTIGYYWGVVSPGRVAAASIEAEISLAQGRISQIPEILAERSELQNRLKQKREELQLLETALPHESHVSDVLHQVASQAQLAGLDIARLEPLPTLEFASYSAHPFHLSCRGTFADITEFLKGLESQSRLITFGNVNFSRGNDQGGGAPRSVQANIDFNVFSRNAKTTKLAENTSRQRSLSSDK